MEYTFTKDEAFNNAVTLEKVREYLVRSELVMTDENVASFTRTIINQIDMLKRIPWQFAEDKGAQS